MPMRHRSKRESTCWVDEHLLGGSGYHDGQVWVERSFSCRGGRQIPYQHVSSKEAGKAEDEMENRRLAGEWGNENPPGGEMWVPNMNRMDALQTMITYMIQVYACKPYAYTIYIYITSIYGRTSMD